MTNCDTPIQTPVDSKPQPAPPAPETPNAPPPGPAGKAIAALILGILSLICCGFFTGIPAIIIGKQEMNAIKQGRSNKEGFTLAQVGFILGIVGSALSCLGALIYIILIIFGISVGAMQEFQGGI